MARKKITKPNNWIVLTGAPSSGKTTLLRLLEQQGYRVVYELARTYIDQEMAKGLSLAEIRKDELAFQQKILQLKVDVEKTLPNDEYVFLERGIPDSIAYYEVCGVKREKLLNKHSAASSYHKVFLLELPEFIPDYARTENAELAQRLEQLLEQSYLSLGMPITRIPSMTIEDRLQFILKEAL